MIEGQVTRVSFTHGSHGAVDYILAAYTRRAFFTANPTFKTSSKALGKSEEYLHKIDCIIYSAQEQTNKPTDRVEISDRAFKAMQSDHKIAPRQENQQLQEREQKPVLQVAAQEKAAVQLHQVHISELKQWEKEAQQLGRSEAYLNKIGQFNQLAGQKASPDGFVKIKGADFEKMRGDRQEFKWTQSQAKVQSKGQGMKL